MAHVDPERYSRRTDYELKARAIPAAATVILAAGGRVTRTATTTTTVPAAGGQKVATVEHPAAASMRGQVRHTVTGQVTDVERNTGQVVVRTNDGSKLTLQMPTTAVANIRDGDTVSVDVVIVPK